MKASCTIIGIGSPHGDDRAGWLVIQRLQKFQDLTCQLKAVSNPIDMLDHLECSKLIVVDAAYCDAARPSFQRFVWPDDRLALASSQSSHGIGLCYTLRMAEELERLPAETICYAIVRGNESMTPDASPDAATLESVEKVVSRIVNESA